MAQQYPNSGFGSNGATTNSFLNNYGNSNGFLNSYGKSITPSQSTPAPNMSTNAGPVYSPPPALGSLGSTPVVKHTIAKDGTQSVTHAAPVEGAKNTPPAQTDYTHGGTTPGGATYDTSGHLVSVNGQPPAQIGESQSTSIPSTVNPNQSLQYARTNNGPQGTPPPSTYPGFIGALGQTATQGSPDAQAATTGLLNKSQGPSQQYTDAYNNAQGYNSQLVSSLQNEANAEATNRLNPIPLGDQTGREAVIRNQYGQQQQALGAGFQGASTLINGANTQQGLQISGLNQAGGLANQTQGLKQSGLVSGANATAPQLGQPGSQYYQPTQAGNGTAAGGVGLTPAVLSQYAQMAATGQYSAIPSSITSNPVLNAQLNDAAKAINPSYSPITSTAQGGITTQQTQQVAQYKSALQQGQNLAAQATDLINTFGLNPSEINKANGAIQTIAANTSNPYYQALNNYLADISSRYAQILTPPGGAATDTTRGVAAGMLNNLASGSSLKTVLDSLDNQANAVIAGVPTTQSSNSGGSTGGTVFGSFFGNK